MRTPEQARAYAKKYRSRNLEAVRARDRAYQRANSEKLAEKSKQWARDNPERAALNKKRWTAANRERVACSRRAWTAKNLARVRQASAAKRKARRRSDPNFRILVNLRTRYYLALTGVVKRSATTRDLLGCSIPQLRTHLESKFQPGMTWENYGPVWHVDHKRPCASFDLTNPEQQRICFHWTNLQPLYATENMKKGARVSLGEV